MTYVNNMNDVMIDIETLGTRYSSTIVQIGACYFNRETGEIGDTFSQCVHHNDMDEYTTDYTTIDWWLHQSEEARNAVFDIDNSVEIEVAIHKLSLFLKYAEYVWSHATFDIPILMNAFEKTGYNFPVHYTGMRDIRTLMDLAEHYGSSKREGIHHNVLDDCKFQVKYCVEAINNLKGVDKLA